MKIIECTDIHRNLGSYFFIEEVNSFFFISPTQQHEGEGFYSVDSDRCTRPDRFMMRYFRQNPIELPLLSGEYLRDSHPSRSRIITAPKSRSKCTVCTRQAGAGRNQMGRAPTVSLANRYILCSATQPEPVKLRLSPGYEIYGHRRARPADSSARISFGNTSTGQSISELDPRISKKQRTEFFPRLQNQWIPFVVFNSTRPK